MPSSDGDGQFGHSDSEPEGLQRMRIAANESAAPKTPNPSDVSEPRPAE
jgi:hypothetical protein